MRRRSMLAAGALLALPVVLVLEVGIALVRVEDLDGFPSPALDGTIGSGDAPLLRITWIGDSTGEGTGASRPGTTLPHVFAAGLGRPVELTVLAVSGARVADAVAEQLPKLAATEPDWIVLGIGSNDVTHLTTKTRLREQLDELYAGVHAVAPERVITLGIGEFAATPLFWQPLRTTIGRRGHELGEVVREAARAHSATYVDIRARTGPSFVADPARLHARDGFHPSDAGYQLWAEAMLATIEA